jgi:hypothetical protein
MPPPTPSAVAGVAIPAASKIGKTGILMLVPWIMRLRPSQELRGFHDYQDNSRQGFKFLDVLAVSFSARPG